MKAAARLLALFPCLLVLACSGGSDDGEDETPRADGGRPSDAGTDAGDLGLRGAGTALIAHGGGLVVAGAAEGVGTDFLVARFDTQGRLDTAFGDGGVVLTDFEGNGGDPAAWSNDEAVALAVDGDSLVVAGVGRGPAGAPGVSMALARYTRTGQLDTTFGGGDGRVISDFNPGNIENDSAIRALAVLPDRRIYAGGSVYNGSSRQRDYVIVRYLETGAVDSSFSGGSGAGIVRHFASGMEEVRGLVLQDSRVVAGGGSHFRAARFLDTGALDTSFGTDGSATHTGGEAFAMAERPDGRLVLAGLYEQSQPDGGTAFALKVVLYSADGELDGTFGTGGAAVHVLGSASVMAVKGLAVEPSGRLAIFATLVAGGFPHPGVVRLLDTGALDTGFGAGGVLLREDVALPLLAPAFNFSGNGAALVDGALWFTDTRLAGGAGNRVLLERAPLP